MLTSLVSAIASLSLAQSAPPNTLYLESLDLSQIDQGWGSAHAAKSVEGHPLTIAGKTYEHGVGTHAISEFPIELHGAATRFTASVGIDDETKGKGSVVFVVLVDGKEAARTRTLRHNDAPAPIDIDLTGAKDLILRVEDAGDSIDYDHADWADAKLTLKPDATQKPTTVSFDVPVTISMARPGVAPRINAPHATGATPGRPFLFRIPATGQSPLAFKADHLPEGLTLDPSTGIISGSLKSDGSSTATITVSSAHGSATSKLTIIGGTHTLAQTPPMGWNSWNVWGTAVDDAKVRAAADASVARGLAAAGYQYINIDDAWEGTRDAEGRIQTNEKFPDMKALADYVHSKGLKLGIYSSPGPKTCAGFEGSWKHEELDAQQYAAWGIDLLKYDWCSYHDIAPKPTPDDYKRPYQVMRAALDKAPRDIVFSMCQYGMGNVWTWGGEQDVGGNYWRTTDDITDTWRSMSTIGFSQSRIASNARPGHWNDPDMLVVGTLGWGPNLRPTKLRPQEQVTHITLWAMIAAPLLIGCDLSQIDDFTLALLTNPEVIEIDQDPLGHAGKRLRVEGDLELWTRNLADGTLAVAAFNRSRKPGTIRITSTQLGLRSEDHAVRDLWQRKDLPPAHEFQLEPPPHGAILLKVGSPKEPGPAAHQ